MNNILFAMIMGHFVGDYLFQPLWMAKRKTEKSNTGAFICEFHALIYTVTVCLSMFQAWNVPFLYFVFVCFVSHYLIDRYSIGNLWLKLIKGRFINKNTMNQSITWKRQTYDVAFSSIVYVVVDNTLHILIMWRMLDLLGIING